jgi:uncharacterized membrane protein
MSRNDPVIDELRDIRNRLEKQGKTLRLRFYLNMAITFIVLSLSVLLASLGLGKAIELRWLVLILLLGGILIIYWARLDLSQDYRKCFAVSGSILLVAGVLGWAILLQYLFPFIVSLVRIVAGLLVNLALILGVILMSLAPRRVRRNRV